MKIGSVVVGRRVYAAAALGDGELLIPSMFPMAARNEHALPTSVRGILSESDGLARLRTVVERHADGYGPSHDELVVAGALIDEADAEFVAPVPDPSHFMGVGISYHQHLKEMGNVPVPKHPVLFLCSTASLSGHRRPITMPPSQPDMIDYEGELAIIIGKSCYGVSVEDAASVIAGYTIHNDVSARDHVAEVMSVTAPLLMMDAWGRNIAAKQHPTFSPMGPYFVTADEIADPHALHLTTRVNGALVQDVRTDDLIFTISQYVSYVAQWYPLQPGDIISTGSPGGVGIARNPPMFLKAGDTVEVGISGVGSLSNRLEPAPLATATSKG